MFKEKKQALDEERTKGLITEEEYKKRNAALVWKIYRFTRKEWKASQ